MRFVALILLLSFHLAAHPLDPLTAPEIDAAAKLLGTHHLLGEGWALQELSLKDPDKTRVLAKKSVPRFANAVLVNLSQNKFLECVLDLSENKLVSETPILRGQPALLDGEFTLMEKIVRADPRFKEAMNKRGITKLEDVHVEPWGAGDVRSEKVDETHRLGRAVFYLREGSQNPYARPIEGAMAVIDMTTQRVAAFTDTGTKPVSNVRADFFKDKGLKVQTASQKSAEPSPIHIKGHEVAWKNWRFHVGVNYREGMVISLLRFVDQGKARSVLYRGSLSEMVVPYADPDPNWYWRAAFDEGEYSVGAMTQSLTPGVHTPDHAVLMDVTLANADGSVKTIPNGLALYERDGGLLWSHADYLSGAVAAKRGRELVALHMFTVGNYDYVLTWVFKEDGAVEVQALLTGIIAAKGVDAPKCERCKEAAAAQSAVFAGKLDDDFGAVVAKNIVGVTHEHFFNFRLDFAVDGLNNSVAELRFEKSKEGEANPHGNMFVMKKTVLASEKEGGRDAEEAAGLRWVVFNPNVRSPIGHFPGYALIPGPGAKPLQQSNSKVASQAAFLKHNVWVTRFEADEKNAAGPYPNQNPGDGVAMWTERNANIHNQDVVVWYTMGLVHLPCPEDWPVMPVTKAGFALKPTGFFTQNPTLSASEAVIAQN